MDIKANFVKSRDHLIHFYSNFDNSESSILM